MARYSRLASVEEKRNLKKAFLYVLLSIIAFVFLLFLGLPTLIKFAGFLGNLGKSDKPIEVTDITPPAPPQFDNIPDFTNEESFKINGTSENGAVVTLTANSSDSEVVADSEGEFNFVFNLKEGENTLKAKAKDTSGNESSETKLYKIVFDNTEPQLEVTSPNDGASYYGSGQRQIVIKGKVNESVSLTVNEKPVSINDDGEFIFSTTLSEGSNSFEIKAVDPAGNESTLSLALNFTP